MRAARILSRIRLRRVRRIQPARWLERGATALEFAIVSPLVIVVIFLSLELGIGLWADATLEVAASRVSRLGQLGVEGDCTTEVRKVLEDAMIPWVSSPDELKIDVRLYHPGAYDPDEVDLGNPVCNAGDRGDMVIYHIAFERPSFTGILGWFDLQPLEYRRTVLIQNEP